MEDLVLSIVREWRMTCVIVTHNMAQARRIADAPWCRRRAPSCSAPPWFNPARDRADGYGLM